MHMDVRRAFSASWMPYIDLSVWSLTATGRVFDHRYSCLFCNCGCRLFDCSFCQYIISVLLSIVTCLFCGVRCQLRCTRVYCVFAVHQECISIICVSALHQLQAEYLMVALLSTDIMTFLLRSCRFLQLCTDVFCVFGASWTHFINISVCTLRNIGVLLLG